MSKRATVAALVVAGTVCALLVAVFFGRTEVRHSAKYGFSMTIDPKRLVAVPGGYVTANFPNFNRIDLDLRAYSAEPTYDLMVHIRPAVAGASDVRTIPLSVDGASVFHRKGAFGNPFVTVRFDPIKESNGKTYYVWVERGPRNQDDVITVWSIKSYSRVAPSNVVSAMLERVNGAWGFGSVSWLLTVGLVTIAVGAGGTLGALILVGSSARMPFGTTLIDRWQDHSPDGIQ
jgi:hypothetical protein